MRAAPHGTWSRRASPDCPTHELLGHQPAELGADLFALYVYGAITFPETEGIVDLPAIRAARATYRGHADDADMRTLSRRRAALFALVDSELG
jgi:hypothetical protein